MGPRDTFCHGGLARLPNTPYTAADPPRVYEGVPVTARGDEDHHASPRAGRFDFFILVAREKGRASVASLGAGKMGEKLKFGKMKRVLYYYCYRCRLKCGLFDDLNRRHHAK